LIWAPAGPIEAEIHELLHFDVLISPLQKSKSTISWAKMHLCPAQIPATISPDLGKGQTIGKLF
jgi:hypothetical protein